LRHTHGSHSVAAGTPLDIVQQKMGHASIDTTTIYVTSEDRRRMKAMQTFWGRAAGNRSAGEGAQSEPLAE
jgi:integrase